MFLNNVNIINFYMSEPQGIIYKPAIKEKHAVEWVWCREIVQTCRHHTFRLTWAIHAVVKHWFVAPFQVMIILIKQWIRDLVLHRHPNGGPCHEKHALVLQGAYKNVYGRTIICPLRKAITPHHTRCLKVFCFYPVFGK